MKDTYLDKCEERDEKKNKGRKDRRKRKEKRKAGSYFFHNYLCYTI